MQYSFAARDTSERGSRPGLTIEILVVRSIFIRGQSPVVLIRAALAQCPDESPAPATSELKFIADADLRANLRNDIGAVTRALSNGEWKAATVLAGSTIEALLLWSLSQRPLAEITKATIALTKSGELTRLPDPKLERWTYTNTPKLQPISESSSRTPPPKPDSPENSAT